MGKVKFSAAISEIRNKVGGVVYSRNRYGAYMRNYVVPENNNTDAQAAVRATFGEISASWKTLSDSQRGEWSSVAASLKKTDIFGSQYSSNGFQFYVQLNTERVLVGSSISATPPAITGVPQFSDVSVAFDYAMGEFIFDIANSDLTSDQALVIRSTNGQSQGKTFFKNLYGVIAVVSDATSVPFNAFGSYIVKYGAYVDMTRVGWQLYVVDKNTGLRSAPINGYFDVEASGYNPYAQAYFDELPTLPSTPELDAINSFYNTQGTNFFALADKSFLFGMPYEDNTLIDLINPSVNPATLISTPTFVAGKGLTGGLGIAVDSKYNPAVDAVHYDLNTGWIAIWGNSNTNENKIDTGNYGGADTVFVQIRESNSVFGAVNANTYVNATQTDGIGLTVLKRINSTQVEYWFNGVLVDTITTASTGIASVIVFILANNAAGTPFLESNRQISHWAMGGGDIDVASYYTDLVTLAAVLGW